MSNQTDSVGASGEKPAVWVFVTVKMPIELADRLDRWRETQKSGLLLPSRVRTINWIVQQFLLKEEAKAAAKRSAKRRK